MTIIDTAARDLAEARDRRERADDESIWWRRAGETTSTHVLRPDGSWAIYRVSPGRVETWQQGEGE